MDLSSSLMRNLILLASIVIRAYVATILWQWFVVPTFHLVPLTIPVAIGLSLILRLMVKTPQSADPTKETIADVFLVPLLGPFVLLGIGYIAAQCMF